MNVYVYVRNCCLGRSTGATNPFKLWFGKLPNISNQKGFGCDCLVKIPDQLRQKRDRKSERSILPGYCEDSKGYRIWNIRKKTVDNSIDVRLDENTILGTSSANRNTTFETRTSPSSAELDISDKLKTTSSDPSIDHSLSPLLAYHRSHPELQTASKGC